MTKAPAGRPVHTYSGAKKAETVLQRKGNRMTEKLAQILAAREQRMLRIRQALLDYPDTFLVSVKLNIPGPEKVSELTPQLLQIATTCLEQRLNLAKIDIIHSDKKTTTAGEEALYILAPKNEAEDPFRRRLRQKIKLMLIEIEDSDPLGRLFDLDLWQGHSQVKRSELGLPPRRCLLCEEAAVICAREQRHTLSELKQSINLLLQSDPRICHTNMPCSGELQGSE
ncbi:MAG: citrate lyase holo-[acyl-carrier protein] synthase [Saccharofermentanales bacterium]|nr:citrate lyase holo-[acyl-carrier protein] synthase [Bacillota bacterium]